MTTLASSKAAVGLPQVGGVEPDELISFAYELDSEKLASTLHKLSQTVSKNARVTNSTTEEVTELRSYVDLTVNKVMRMVNVVDDATRAIKEQQRQLADEFHKFQRVAVLKEELDKEKSLLWASAKRTEKFVDEVELGRADRLNRLIKSNMEAFVPRWYEPVSNSLWAKIRSELGLQKEGFLTRLQEEIVLTEQKIRGQQEQMREEFTVDMDSLQQKNDQKRTESDSVVDTMRREFDKRLEQMERSQREAIEALRVAFDTRLELAEDDTSALMTSFGLPPNASRGNYGRTPESEALSLVEDSSSGGGGAAANAALEVILSSPPFRALEERVLRVQGDRLLASSESMTTSMENIKATLELNLHDKVGLSKLQDLLYQYRDETLYTNVKSNTAEVEKLKNEKVSVATLQGLMADKAERNDLELKVDKSYMTSVQQQMDSRLEEMSRLVFQFETEFHRQEEAVKRLMDTVGSDPTGRVGLPVYGSPLVSGGVPGSPAALASSGGELQLPAASATPLLHPLTAEGSPTVPRPHSPMHSGVMYGMARQRGGEQLDRSRSGVGGSGASMTSPPSASSPTTRAPPAAATPVHQHAPELVPPASSLPSGSTEQIVLLKDKDKPGSRGARVPQQSFSDMLFKMKPEEFAKGNLAPPKH